MGCIIQQEGIMGAESIKTVFGFIYRHGKDDYPSELLTVVESDGDFFRVDKHGDSYLLIDESTGCSESAEEISARDSFTRASINIQSSNFDELTSFGFSLDSIKVGTPHQILKAIEKELDRDQHTGESLQRLITAHHEWERFLQTSPTPE
jgi:hypothetical protein